MGSRRCARLRLRASTRRARALGGSSLRGRFAGTFEGGFGELQRERAAAHTGLQLLPLALEAAHRWCGWRWHPAEAHGSQTRAHARAPIGCLFSPSGGAADAVQPCDADPERLDDLCGTTSAERSTYSATWARSTTALRQPRHGSGLTGPHGPSSRAAPCLACRAEERSSPRAYPVPHRRVRRRTLAAAR